MPHTHLQFDSFTALLAALDAASIPAGTFSQTKGRTEPDSWVKSYGEARSLAANGWPEGLKQVSETTATLTKRIAYRVAKPETYFDVSGSTFDISRVISGIPECFSCWRDSEAMERPGNKIIKIVSSVGATAGVSAEAMINRGAAVCALVELLESLGFRCEVIANSYAINPADPSNGIEVSWTVKGSSDPIQMDQLVYTLAHPSMLRRHIFKVRESNLIPAAQSAACVSGGYWRSHKPTVPGDIVIDAMVGYSGGDFANAQTVEAWVIRQLKTFGVEVGAE